MAPRDTALKLSYEPDTYLCTWSVPDQQGGFVELPGDLSALTNRAPRGSLYGAMPLSWTHAESGQSSAAFPQVVEVPVLQGELANGGTVLLLDARVEYWMPETGLVSGSAALLGRGHLFFSRSVSPAPATSPTGHALFSAVEFQFTALDALLGSAPIAATRFPGVGPENPRDEWTAILNLDADGDWSSDGRHLKASYRGRGQAMSGYSFQLGFSPVARLALDTPATLRALVDEYVEPLNKIASIATGKPQALTYLAVAAEDVDHAPMFQVFGSRITQEPYESATDLQEKSDCALRAKSDGVSLLDVLLRWRQLQLDHHPLIETYGAMVHATDQHPRSRLLLLLQALEGMFGHETKEINERRRVAHLAERESILERASSALDTADARFLKRFLSKRPSENLESAINATVCGLPVNTMDRLAGTGLVRDTIAAEPFATDSAGALRVIRNNLAHGTRGYDTQGLQDVAAVLEQVVRAHALRVLGCPDAVVTRALNPA